MRIRSVRIEDFRKLIGPVCIEGIGDAITVISGDNEEGKSTVLEAIRTVLFTRHRVSGETAERMQPFGQSVRPEISLDFEINGKGYGLRKAFCRRPEAELRWTGGRATGDAAEEKLQEILRFVPPKRGASEPEHQGIWALFWVAQGTSFGALRMSDGSRQTLTKALEGEVGQVLGGDRGRALLQAIRSRFEEMFTATGRPREEYRKCIEAVQTSDREVTRLQGALRAHDHRVNDLEQVRGRLRTYERERIVEHAQERLSLAEAANQRAVALRERLRDAEGALAIARSKRDAADARWQWRAKKIESATRERDEADTAARRVAEARRAAEPLERRLAEARAAEDEKRRAYGEVEAIHGAAEQDLWRARAERELADMREKQRKAVEAVTASQTARSKGLGISVGDADISRLRVLEKALSEAEIRLRAVATRLDFAPDGVKRVFSAEGNVASDRPLLLTEAMTLRLEGFGEITITPGGEDLDTLRRAAKDAGNNLLGALAALGVVDVTTAARAADERRELLAEAETQDRLARIHAPKGLAALDEAVRLKEAELATLRQGAIRPTPTVEAAEADVKAAYARREAVLRMFTEQKAAVEDVERCCRAAREDWIKARALHQGAMTQADRSANELQEDRVADPDARLREAVADATAALATAEALATVAADALALENPEAVALRLEEARDAAKRTQEDIDKLRKTANEIEVELRTLGQQGLGEELAIAQGALDQARKRGQAVEREAKAIKLLYDTLRDAERQAKDAFLGPVRSRVQPFLELLFPGAELELGQDTLDIHHLHRGDVHEPFDCLSIGTREQLAILTRLAFADFLRERGQPAAVILDDALAYADCNRFDRMQLVLRKAAKNLQVLVLTCRERDYIGRGLPIVRLAECRMPEPVG